ncbi:MAG: riboflavin synthase subunit alpha [Gammaproteobacteria bacterium]|nr:riboflavin synthase subunit alpha [Gammaproteobacteria bacterium]MXX94173.1 riboflavin synthase subunit alpha [Gammaproteobacteria bacterium]MYF52339.1 riboflavin synthase subunit alpha [Gammaproteobacteria bacterium]MYK42798.1 riboflavin synthase subunit alpha [Gammaproteobacteria bacterium]
MFSGIVHAFCQVHSLTTENNPVRLVIELGELVTHLEAGQSVAINGVCLTAVAIENSTVSFEVVDQTLRTTNLGELTTADWINVERSLKLGDEIGGHLLSGHIAGLALVNSVTSQNEQTRLEVQIPINWRRFLFPKGFIALNGVSLTLAEYSRQTGLGLVYLIPETLRRTNLGLARVGTSLNLEIDSQTQTIISTVENYLQNSGVSNLPINNEVDS